MDKGLEIIEKRKSLIINSVCLCMNLNIFSFLDTFNKFEILAF
jgi:hypothetical protein